MHSSGRTPRFFSNPKFLVIAVAALFLSGFFLAPSAEAATVLASGTISTAQTWTANNVYVIQASVTVGSGGTLTINSSTIVKLAQNAVLDVAASGTLKANGVSAGKIYFTSYDDDSVGGDTNGDGTSTTPHAGDGGYIQSDAGASSTIANAIIRYGGATNPYYSNIYQTGGKLTFTNVTIASSSNYGIKITGGTTSIANSTTTNNGNYGIYETGSSGGLTLSTSTFLNNTNGAAYIDLGSGFTFTPVGNSATGTGYRGFIVAGSLATTTTTWAKDLPYLIQSSVTVASGTTLTVNPGTIVKFSLNAALIIPAHGTLSAVGTSTNKIYFTAITDDSVGGDTNYDTTSTTPQKGDGGYIEIDANGSSTIKNSIIRYGGATNPYFANLYQTGGSLTLSSVTVASSSNYGLKIAGGTTSIVTSTVASNGNYGIYETGSSGGLTLTTSTFSNNTNGDAYFDLGSGFTFTPSGNTATGTGYRGFIVAGSLATSSTTWVPGGLPYIIQSSVTVASGTTLTVNHGTVTKFSLNAALEVAGHGILSAQGTSSDPIYFTALTDDSVGGDTNYDTTSTIPAKGDGGYIQIDPSASSTITNAVVRYGGATNPYFSNIYQTGGNLTLSNVTVASSSNYGVAIGTGTSTTNIKNSTTTNNGNYGIYETGSAGSLTLTTSTFSNNTNGDAYFDLGSGFTFTPSGNSATGTGYRGFIVAGSLATTTTTWAKDLPYLIQSSVTVASGTTLLVNHGAVTKFSLNAALIIAAHGTLNVQGTSADPTYFTAITDDSIAGDTNYDTTSTTPQRGDSGYIEVDANGSGTINAAVIRYGGATNPSFANIYQTGGSLTISSTTIASSSNYGFNMLGGTVSITGSTIRNNGNFGISEGSSNGSLTLTNNNFSTNSGADAYIEISSGINFVPSGNTDNATTTGTGVRGFVMSGTLATSTTWNSGGLPYVIEGLVTVPSGTTLTIAASVVKFGFAAALDVASNGTLTINGGAPTQYENYYSSLTDDFGWDTNADGTSTTPHPGDGGYIEFDAGSIGNISSTEISYGGGSFPYANIYQAGGNVALYDVAIASSSNYGFRSTGGTSTISASQILSNAYGIYMTSGTVSVNNGTVFENNTYDAILNSSNITSTAVAENNYWNANSGPYNINSNPGGAGDPVSDYVDFNNWINNNNSRQHYTLPAGWSAVSGGALTWYNSSTKYLSEFVLAVSTWNALGRISISSTTVLSSATLIVSDVNRSDLGWDGVYCPATLDCYGAPTSTTKNVIWFNEYMDDPHTTNEIQHTATHEFGHALGLAHSYVGNIMFYYFTEPPQLGLGDQDKSDYQYLWGP